MPKDTFYTVVQHSAWLINGNPQFVRGLESQCITKAEADRVVRAGGRVFSSYVDAESYAEREMYPDGYTGLVPIAPGKFGVEVDDGRPAYIPAPVQPKHLQEV